MSAEHPDRQLEPGDTIDDFEIKKLIGQGAMGDVFLAEHLPTQRIAALKILPPSLSTDIYSMESFTQEIMITCRLHHDHIVNGFASGVSDGHHYLALRYLDGEMLEAVVERQGAIDEKDAVYVIRQLAAAMKYAWETHQVIHRDINPANVMITSEGLPVLIDLGLAQIAGKPLTAVQQGMIEGTPNYMSPEQVVTPADVDFRADIYALGATLYYLLTTKIPFGEYNEDDILDLLVKNSLRLTDPRKYTPGITNGCVLLIEHMLARRPHKRHRAWDDLLADLQLVEDGKSNRIAPIPQEHSQMKREGVASAKGRSVTLMQRTATGSIKKVKKKQR